MTMSHSFEQALANASKRQLLICSIKPKTNNQENAPLTPVNLFEEEATRLYYKNNPNFYKFSSLNVLLDLLSLKTIILSRNFFINMLINFFKKYTILTRRYLPILRGVVATTIWNQQQRVIIGLQDEPCLVIAGAGSGKTATVCEKIAALCARLPPGKKILAITFTNKAAAEMLKRLKTRHIGGRQVLVCTFHRLGLMILQRFAAQAGLKPNYSLLDQDDRIQILKQLRPGTLEADLQNLLHQISRIKQYPSLESFLSHTSSEEYDPELITCWHEYQAALRDLNSIDLDDLVFIPVQLLSQETIAQHIRVRFDYLFIDEYQDTNLAQYYLFQRLADPQRFTLVGDDDQSIYAWRGARPENLHLVQQDFPNLHVVMLEENFRSTSAILNMANALIRHNDHLFEKKLWSQRHDGIKPQLLVARDVADEAALVIDSIAQRLRGSEHSFCILMRTNFQTLDYEKGLRENRIPYQIIGSQSVFHRAEIKDLMAYLRLILNEQDDAAFKRIINIPRRGLGIKKMGALIEYASTHKLPLLQSCRQLRFLSELDPSSKKAFEDFSALMATFTLKFRQSDSVAWIRELLAALQYDDWLEQIYPHTKTAQQHRNSLYDFVSWIERSFAKEPQLEDILRKLLIIDQLGAQEQQRTAQVTLATMHAAKGLEFDEVYLIGCNEGLLPHHQSESSLEEERRLMYVGITRAKQRLTISYCEKIGSSDAAPSRFINEIGTEYFQDNEASDSSGEELSWEEMRALLGY